MASMKTITIFGSSGPRPGDHAYENAFILGTALATNGYAVCNGGYAGTMEAAARGARSAAGHTIGVTCRIFDRTPNEWIIEEILTPSLEERLKTLVMKGDGFVLLPGGTGTLLELAYVLESMNKGFIPQRPVILLGDFWIPVLEPLRQEMMDDRLGAMEGFLSVVTSPVEAIEKLR